MPGLFGIFAKDPLMETSEIHALGKRMASSMERHSWLKTEIWSGDRFCGGRVHLGVFNPNSQPMISEDGSINFFDGEFYETNEQSTDRTPTVQKIDRIVSDPGKLAETDGHFCFSRLSAGGDELTVISDRFGYRPLHFYETPRYFAFSAEVKALVSIMDSEPEIDQISAKQFLSFGWILSDRTWWKNVTLQPGADICTVTQQGSRHSRYWDPNDIRYEPRNEDDVVEEFGRLWSVAVTQRSRPGVMPFELSGGLDSRFLLAELRRQGQEVLAITYGDSLSSEIEIARKVARLANVEHKVHIITAENWWTGREQMNIEIDGMVSALHSHDGGVLELLGSGNRYMPMNFAGDLIFGGSFLGDHDSRCKASDLRSVLEGFFIPNPFVTLDEVVDESQADLGPALERQHSDFFWLRHRCARLTLGGPVSTAFQCETVFPSISLALLKLAYGNLSDEQRIDSRFYNRCLLRFHPKYFRTIPWQKTGQGLQEPALVSYGRRLSKAVKKRMGVQKRQRSRIANYNMLIRSSKTYNARRPKRFHLDKYLDGSVSKWLEHFETGEGDPIIADCVLTAENYLDRTLNAFRPESGALSRNGSNRSAAVKMK